MSTERTTASKTRLDRAIVALEAIVGIGVVVAIVGKTYGMPATVSFVFVGISAAAAGYFLVRMTAALRDETLDVPGRVLDEDRERLEHEKLLLLQGIKEFEADAGVGKVDKADYDHLRKTAEARAVEIIRALKDSDARWLREAEVLVAERLGPEAARPAVVAPAAAAPAAAEAAGAAPVAASPGGVAVLEPVAAVARPETRRIMELAIAQVFDDRAVDFSLIGDGAELRCEGCSGTNDSDARYCIHCGRPRSEVTR